MLRRLTAAILAACILITISGCDMLVDRPVLAEPIPDFGLTPSPTPSPAPTPTPLPSHPVAPSFGGHITIPMGMPTTLNPLLNTDYRVDRILRLIFEPMVIFNQDIRPIANPAITEAIVFSPDGRSITITLLDEIFWDNGTPIVAADIGFSINVLRNFAPANAVYRRNVDNITGHNVVNNRTIVINLAEQISYMKYMLAFPIISSAFYGQTSMAPFNRGGGRNMQPMGNGPFMMAQYVPASHLSLVASENPPGGRPYIAEITALILRDSQSEIYAFESGVVDIASIPVGAWGRYFGMGKRRGFDYTTNNFDFIGFNFAHDTFSDLSARQAIASAVNTDYVIARAYLEAAAAASPINPQSWLHYNNTTSFPFDLARSEQLFGGFELTGSISILVNYENAERVLIAAHLAENLNSIDVDTIVEAVDFAEFQRRVSTGDFDIFIGGLSLAAAPNLASIFHSTNVVSSNITGYATNEMDLLLYIARTATTDLAWIAAKRNLQSYIAENLPIYGIAFRQEILALNPRIHGNAATRIDDNLANIKQWFIP